MIRSRPGFATVHIDDEAPHKALPARMKSDMEPAIARHTRAKPAEPGSPLVQHADVAQTHFQDMMQARADAAYAKLQREQAAKTSTELLPTSEPSTPPITTNPQADESKPYRPFSVDSTDTIP